MAVVAKLEILTTVGTAQLTAGFKKATSSLQAFGSKVVGVGTLFKAAAGFFAVKNIVGWIKDSLVELAKTERGAYNTIEAFKGVKKIFEDWGQAIARGLAPYLEVAAKGLQDLLNGAVQFGAETTRFQSASGAIRSMIGYLATAAQVVTLVWQAFASGIYTSVELVAKLIGKLAELEKKLPKSMQLGISDQVQPFVKDIEFAADAARKATEKNFNDLLSGNTWGKQLEEMAQAVRDKAIQQGPVPLKPAEPAGALLKNTKEALSASLKADRLMNRQNAAADPQVKAVEAFKNQAHVDAMRLENLIRAGQVKDINWEAAGL